MFVKKIRSLEAQYGSMRRTRGDGNCFFRSFVFAYMESLVRSGDLAERNRSRPDLCIPRSTHSMHACMHSCMQGACAPTMHWHGVTGACGCRVVTCIRQWGKKMVDAGFQELVFEDAMEVWSWWPQHS